MPRRRSDTPPAGADGRAGVSAAGGPSSLSPLARLGYALAAAAGVAAARTQPAARAAVTANLAHVLGRPPAARELDAVFAEAGRAYLDLARLAVAPPDALAAALSVDGWEHLDAALAAGRGAILVGTHCGAAALAGQAFTSRGVPVAVPVEPLRPAWRHRLYNWPRGRGGIELVRAGPSAWWRLRAVLAAGGIVALTADRPLAGASAEVRLLGCPARLPLGPALLALRSAAPLLPFRAHRRPDGSVHGSIEPPLVAADAAGLWSRRTGRDAALRLLAQRTADSVGYTLSRWPLQWLAFASVWEEPHPAGPTGARRAGQ